MASTRADATETTAPTPGQPAWEIARLFPAQGHWSGEDYLALNRLTNRYVEFSDGEVEVLEMPTLTHQRIVAAIASRIEAHISASRVGTVVVAPYPVRLWEGKFREPDVVFALAANAGRLTDDFADGADLVVEVVSKGDPNRDIVLKRAEYARAGIAEYWIADPQAQAITVLTLDAASGRYDVHGEFRAGQAATSRLLAGLAVDVTEALNPR